MAGSEVHVLGSGAHVLGSGDHVGSLPKGIGVVLIHAAEGVIHVRVALLVCSDGKDEVTDGS